jgi:hypothetical protein
MLDQTDIDQRLRTRFQEIVHREKCDDWGAKLQDLCETFWTLLDNDNDIAPTYMDLFVDILLRESNFALARLVIPEFRNQLGESLENYHKQQIMERTMHIRAKLTIVETTNQADFDKDQPLYRAEKDIFAEAEMYRASLLLYNHGKQNTEERENMRRWLAARPQVQPQVRPVNG